MDWKPPSAWPFGADGAAAEPHVMQLPASVRQVIDPTYWDNTATIPIDVAAGVILRHYIPDISNFIQRQRSQYSLGIAEYHRMRATAPQLVVDYINNSGQEIITVTLQPTTTTSGRFLLAVNFTWSDEQITHDIVSVIHITTTVTVVDVSISASVPALFGRLIVTPGGGPTVPAGYLQQFVFDVDNPQTVVFSLTGQGDYTGFVPFTFVPPSSKAGITQINDGMITGGGPWPTVQISLYDKALYFFDSKLKQIKPLNPDNDPGAVALTQLPRTQIATIPSTDQFYYDSVSPPLVITSGGSYSIVGLLRGGSLALNVATVKGIPVVWPSLPTPFTVAYVNDSPPGQHVVGGQYVLPNPPPPFNMGVYSVIPDPNDSNPLDDTIYYNFGHEPTPSNTYTGPYPARF